jgi:SAM-dependent methyltransferase
MKSIKAHAPNTKKSVQSKRGKTARVHGSRGLHDTLLDTYNGINGFVTLSIGTSSEHNTYGEVSPQGIRILYEKFKQYAPLKSRRRFYDLGSGVGKVVLGMAVLNHELESYGIEINPERARLASMAHSRIKTPHIQRRVHFIQDSIFNPSLRLKEACWIFVSNLCFDSEMQEKLSQKIDEVEPGTVIICSRALNVSKERFEVLENNCVVPMSWSNSSSCWIYRRI